MKIIIAGSLAALMILAGAAGTPAVSSDGELEILVIQKSGGEQITYHVEVANTDATRRRGLMYREQLPADQGMLLDFMGGQNVAIWMKHTYISLDIIFIDAAGKIVYIHHSATPLSTRTISTDQRVRAVLELNAGQVDAHGMRVGDQVIFPSFDASE
jgi:hypothetical protein